MTTLYTTISVLLFVLPFIYNTCYCQPGKDLPVMGNLRHTFGSQEEIPAAFFDAPSQAGNQMKRTIYPPCQDGSGGLCVEEGQCPPEKKAEANNTMACGPGLECCFGPAMNDKSCYSRGGECMTRSSCGAQPIFTEAIDCDSAKGEICCVLI